MEKDKLSHEANILSINKQHDAEMARIDIERQNAENASKERIEGLKNNLEMQKMGHEERQKELERLEKHNQNQYNLQIEDMKNKADERQRNPHLAKINAENQSKLDILKEQTKGDIEELKTKNSQELEKIKAESQEKTQNFELRKDAIQTIGKTGNVDALLALCNVKAPIINQQNMQKNNYLQYNQTVINKYGQTIPQTPLGQSYGNLPMINQYQYNQKNQYG